MKNKIHQYFLVFILLTSIVSTNVFAAKEGISFASDLISGQPATVDVLNTQLRMGYFDVSISDVPEGAGIYPGWCIQKDIVGDLHNQPATLYSSLSPNLPSDVAGLPWNKINYVLNHKIRGHNRSDTEFINDVQGAIWLLLGEQDIDFFASKQALRMVREANAHPDYMPGVDDIVAVIVYSDGMSTADPNSYQESIIEYRMDHLITNTPTPTTTGAITDTPTSTATGTNTFTPTATGTLTDTPTSTATGTNTFTPTATGTLTNTPTPTVTGTVTNTFTPTSTPTVTPAVACEPIIVKADFSQVNVGDSVEGLNKVAVGLNIKAKGMAVKILESSAPRVYGAPNGKASIINGGLNPNGGFSDVITESKDEAHQYTFTFAQDVSVSKFSLHMLDFGDFNPTESVSHYASITAYDINNNIVSKQEIVYNTITGEYISPQYGDLYLTGDIKTASIGEPGNWMWNVSGIGITKVVLDFGVGFDPKIAFDTLAFITECKICSGPIVKSDLSKFQAGDSVEGLNAVAPDLNIDAKGNAVKVFESALPRLFGAPNGKAIDNGGLNINGGFGDITTLEAGGSPVYTFTFSPGRMAEQFSLHMLDFGDYNPTNSTTHYASMTGYDINNVVVSKHELFYHTTTGFDSPEYGDLYLTGDAITATYTASLGLPGDWTWNVNGKNMIKIILEFGDGFDPKAGFDNLSFCLQSP